MYYAKGQREAIVLSCALAIAALLCVIGYVSSGGCGHTGTGADAARGNCTSTTQQAQRAAEYNKQAGAAVKSAAGAVGRAEQHADRATELNQSAQTGVSDCQKLVSDIQADNRRAKQLVDELIGEHQARPTTDTAR